MIVIPAHARQVLAAESPILGDVELPSACAHYLGEASDAVARYRADLLEAQHELSRGHSAGLRAMVDTLETRLSPGALALERSVHIAKPAFERFAAEIDRIHTDARLLIARVDTQLELIRGQNYSLQQLADRCGVPLRGSWNDGPPLTMPWPAAADGCATLAALDAEQQMLRGHHEAMWAAIVQTWRGAALDIMADGRVWESLRAEREAAERVLLGSLGDTPIGQLLAISAATVAGRRSTVAYGVSGELWGVRRELLPLATEHPALTQLIGTSSGRAVWQHPPDPAVVAARWARLTPGARQQLIEQVPWVIGNLPGVPFAARDRANRLLLEHYALRHGELSPECVELLGELATVLLADEQPPASIVSLSLEGEIPMLAVGYGDLDAAASVTWQVPGMDSDAHRALGTWDVASRRLFWEQGALLSEGSTTSPAAAAPAQQAVVAFLAYDTPNLVTVLFASAARVGARRLAAELDGTAATRARNTRLTNLAVAAHSYGTPVAANALTQTHHRVHSLTLVGSAGLDGERVGSFDELNVQRDSEGRPRVYSTMAAGDQLAPLGAALADRVQPNPQAVYAGREGIAGAYLFSSDGSGTLLPTDGHSVIGEGLRGFLGTHASEGQGYFDRGTQSLRGIAGTTLGRLEHVAGGLRLAEPPDSPDAPDRLTAARAIVSKGTP